MDWPRLKKTNKYDITRMILRWTSGKNGEKADQTQHSG